VSRASIEHWNANQVAAVPDDISEWHSQALLDWRNQQYPRLLELMPVNYPGRTVIDFGCGPGHDTIMFLQNGAAHVYAVDSAFSALRYTYARLKAHGFLERCTLVLVGEDEWRLPKVDHIHSAGVIHHIEDPVSALRKLRLSLKQGAELRMMVYAAESEFVRLHGGPEGFEQIADGTAPIAKAWTRQQVQEIAVNAGLRAEYLGGYLMAENEGPGLGGCWSLKR